MSEAWSGFFIGADGEEPSVTPVGRLVQGGSVVAYVSSLLLLGMTPKLATRILRENWPLVLLVGLAIASAAWSVAPEVTFRRALGIAGTSLVALMICSRISLAEFVRIVAIVLGVVAVLCVAAVALWPEFGIHSDGLHAGAWKGTFIQKNRFGRIMVLGAIASYSALKQGGRVRLAFGALLGLQLFLIAMSQSRTAWLLLLLLPVAAPVVRVLSSQGLRGVLFKTAFLLLALCGVMLAAVGLEPALALMGRDLTLTGRTVLWAAAVAAGLQRPILGYGYKAFWLEGAGGAAAIQETVWGTDTGHGHNSYLDVWLELGVVGLTVLAAVLIVTWRNMLRLNWVQEREESRFLVTAMAYLSLSAMAASAWLDRNSILWILLCVCVYWARRASSAEAADRCASSGSV